MQNISTWIPVKIWHKYSGGCSVYSLARLAEHLAGNETVYKLYRLDIDRSSACVVAPWLAFPSPVAILHNTGYKSGAAICEWALVMSFFVLFGLFGSEFRHIDFHQLTMQKQRLKTQRTNGVVRMNDVS
jgi:hypothetical protein